MATVEIEPRFLIEILMPGLDVNVEEGWFDRMHETIVLRLSGPDVPDCERARIVMTRNYDDKGPAIVMTAALKPVD